MITNSVFHITARTIHQKWFPFPKSRVWELCLSALNTVGKDYEIELMSFVLMSNHYHLIVKSSEENMHNFVQEFNKEFDFFETKYRWSFIRGRAYLYNCYRYIYQNPVRAGISYKCESYPYSTLFHLIHQKKFPMTIYDKFGFKDEFALRGLNIKIGEKEICSIRSSLQTKNIG